MVALVLLVSMGFGVAQGILFLRPANQWWNILDLVANYRYRYVHFTSEVFTKTVIAGFRLFLLVNILSLISAICRKLICSESS